MAECILSSARGALLVRMDHRLGHTASLNKVKRIESIHYMFSDDNGVKLEMNNRNLGNSQMCGNQTTHS